MTAVKIRLFVATGLFAGGLIAIGVWRRISLSGGDATAVGFGPTIAYVAWTVAFIFLLPRFGARFERFGFGKPFSPARHIGLAAAGVAVLQLWGATLEPLVVARFGAGRDLTRFDSSTSSVAELALLIAFSWGFAAFGEEIAFRIVLMRGLANALGDTRTGAVAALLLQAIVFGLVHVYQGPAGVVGTFFSGLVFGSLVLAARGSIWPAVLAHGTRNSIGLILLYLQ